MYIYIFNTNSHGNLPEKLLYKCLSINHCIHHYTAHDRKVHTGITSVGRFSQIIKY